jgi:hypothetical protein
VGNGGDGIHVLGKVVVIRGNLQGSTSAIAGNGGNGIQVSGAAASGTLIQGYKIGTNGAGTTAFANAVDGILVKDGANRPRRGPQPRRETAMISGMRHILGWAAGGLLLIAASARPASAAGPVVPYRPAVPPAYVPAKTLPVPRPAVDPLINRTRPPGWDWWRTYPWPR